jgi:hypothetical protein
MPDYGDNKCSGGTPLASAEYGGNAASYAFNGYSSAATGGRWQADNTSGWLQYHFASAAKIAKISMWSDASPENAQTFTVFTLKASNTGAFGGEEVTLLTVSSGVSWGDNEQKDWEFSNDTAYDYYRITGTAPDYFIRVCELQMFELVTWITGDIDDAVALGDSIEGVSFSGFIADGVSINDQADAFNLTDGITDAAGFNDSILGLRETDLGISDASGIADAIARNIEASRSLTDGTGIADAMSVFNWQQWLEQYDGQVVTRYYFTLTGAADGEVDAVIPISSFSCRRRNGDESYLSVVIPSLDYSTYVTDRPNGDMRLEVAYLFGGVEVLREEIITVDLETVRTDEGAVNQSITLTGHREESFGGQVCTPRGINYRSSTGGKWLLRCQPDPYLRPGDTIRVDGVDLFTADYVSSWVSGNSVSMEVSES